MGKPTVMTLSKITRYEVLVKQLATALAFESKGDLENASRLYRNTCVRLCTHIIEEVDDTQSGTLELALRKYAGIWDKDLSLDHIIQVALSESNEDKEEDVVTIDGGGRYVELNADGICIDGKPYLFKANPSEEEEAESDPTHAELIKDGGHRVEIADEGIYIDDKAILALGSDPIDITVWDAETNIGGIVRLAIVASHVDIIDTFAVARSGNKINISVEKQGNRD